MIFSLIGQGVAWMSSFLAAAAGVSVATAVQIGVAAGQIAQGLALSLISRALQPSVKIPTQEIQAVINQTDAPRRVYVGKNLVGGLRALFDVKDAILYQLVVVAHGRINAYLEHWIDSEPVTLDGNGIVTNTDKAGYVTITTRNGSGQGGNYTALTDNFSTWDATRRLQNQATFLVRSKAPKAEDFSKVFPKAYNTLHQWVIEGQSIYDPRTSSTTYSDNAALVIAHYLRHADGFRLSSSQIDWDSVAAMADLCDEAVPQFAGGTAPKLRLWGYWSLDEEPVQVIQRMHSNSGIRPYETQEGKIGLIGGRYGTPACTLTAKDISEIQTREATNEREGYNVLRVFFMSEVQKFEVTEADAWRDEARLAQEGEIVQEYRMEMCPNLAQARWLAKGKIHDDNRAKVEIITNLVGLKARFPANHGQRHTIMLDYRPEDGSGRVIAGEYEVLDHEFDPVGLRCRIELAKVSRASEAWTPAEEGTQITAPPVEIGNGPPPISATLSQRVILASNSTPIAVLEVTAVAIPDRDDLSVQGRYRKVGDTTWRNMATSGFTAQSGAVEDGQQYEAQARFRGVFDGVDEWHSLGTVTITVDATAPGVPSQLIPSNSVGAVHLSWRNPSTPFHQIRIYRHLINNFGTASLVGTTGGSSGQISDYRDETVSGSMNYFYWVAAANVSGVESAPHGPATITTP